VHTNFSTVEKGVKLFDEVAFGARLNGVYNFHAHSQKCLHYNFQYIQHQKRLSLSSLSFQFAPMQRRAFVQQPQAVLKQW